MNLENFNSNFATHFEMIQLKWLHLIVSFYKKSMLILKAYKCGKVGSFFKKKVHCQWWLGCFFYKKAPGHNW
jgi:hypothetical protein